MTDPALATIGLFVLLAIWALLKIARRARRTIASRGPYLVTRVIDGDTLDVVRPGSGGAPIRIRLLGVDAPETHFGSDKLRKDARALGQTPAEHALRGRASARALRELVHGKLVHLEPPLLRRRGHYGRLLARVWVLDDRGRPAFEAGQRLLRGGYARKR